MSIVYWIGMVLFDFSITLSDDYQNSIGNKIFKYIISANIYVLKGQFEVSSYAYIRRIIKSLRERFTY